ncbi:MULTISPECIES: glycosyltransferase [unclassified Pseudoalteromonas]|uniref:glycosyltransferase n=1 Tax=unclassified Pseudoalteromonas TaxID=194690 RepID=UPI001108B42D|nr:MULTISPECIES: glycosyltransferase [unclassified Pseudoalteromonas]TMN84139.1 glycosyltransferase [Pseudoalteromonas sp. S410]TMN90619.1 glycosyltransferase [Pseudoalteromonas sp. S408]TMN95255.1 glycosyltransferase [Pseudoalteromonas sp. S407]TMN97811.1 glycosyltransferase [Pseudoalteromonas sp. S409]TMO07688.1 glycosyltransferase [Pseudoalteromonas sp. S186]
MKKVLVIGYVWPEPNSSAAGTHMMSLLNAFKAQNWQVEFATPAQRTDHMVNLDDFGITSQSIALNCESFDEYVKAFSPDIVMFDRFMMEEQFGWRIDKHCPNAIKILDTEDLQCLRNARHEAHKGEREFTTSDLHSDIAKREIAAILRCDLSLIISSFEMSLLNSVFKVEPSLLHHLPFMVDLSALPKTTKSFDERAHFMTIGNFRHAPNWDAVLYLQKIWPLIRKQLPKAELHIYGSYPPPKATALNNPKTGFLIKGWADNAYDVMQSARVCLAPLRFGAGIKGKLLEAMIMQTPSVTTNIGAEGMHNDLPWPGKVANNTEDFANAAVELYNSQTDFKHAQQAGNALLNRVYDKVKLSAALINKIDVISNDLSAHREKNFTGQMLKHHTMRSTQYMAQWIAEKNKKLD